MLRLCQNLVLVLCVYYIHEHRWCLDRILFGKLLYRDLFQVCTNEHHQQKSLPMSKRRYIFLRLNNKIRLNSNSGSSGSSLGNPCRIGARWIIWLTWLVGEWETRLRRVCQNIDQKVQNNAEPSNTSESWKQWLVRDCNRNNFMYSFISHYIILRHFSFAAALTSHSRTLLGF